MLLFCELHFFHHNQIKAAGKGHYLLTEGFTGAGQSTYCSSNDSLLYKILAVLLHVPGPHYVKHSPSQTNAIIINLCLEAARSSSAGGALMPSSVYFLGYLDSSIFNSLSQSPLMPFFLLLCGTCIQTAGNFLILWEASYLSRIKNDNNKKIKIEVRMTICKIFFQNMQNFLTGSQTSFAFSFIVWDHLNLETCSLVLNFLVASEPM